MKGENKIKSTINDLDSLYTHYNQPTPKSIMIYLNSYILFYFLNDNMFIA